MDKLRQKIHVLIVINLHISITQENNDCSCLGRVYKKVITMRPWRSQGSCPILTFFELGFTPCKDEQPLRGMELQEKEAQKD